MLLCEKVFIQNMEHAAELREYTPCWVYLFWIGDIPQISPQLNKNFIKISHKSFLTHLNLCLHKL